MHPSRALLLAATLVAAPLRAQARAPAQVPLSDALPPDARAKQVAASADVQRTYFTDSAGAVWLYDRPAKRRVQIAPGNARDITLSSKGDVLAYAKPGEKGIDQYVWIVRLDPTTGLASGPEQKVGTSQGDSPAISPDGQWVAFARDETNGVGQGLVIAPAPPRRGAERVLVSGLTTGIGGVRWSPSGQTLYFAVNPPVECNPGWSCLPLKGPSSPPSGTIRRVAVTGGTATVVVPVRSGWPGLSPDGSMLVFADTGRASRRFVAADTNGNRLDTFTLPAGQTIEGWLGASTLLVSGNGNVRRLNEYSMSDGRIRVVLDSLNALQSPAWSTDGNTIAIAYCGSGPCVMRLVRPSGAPVRSFPLTDTPTQIAWSPDGSRIAYASSADGAPHLSVLDVSTGAVSQAARGDGPLSFRWLANSRALVVIEATGDTESNARVRFRLVDVAGNSRALREYPRPLNEYGGFAIDSSTAVLAQSGSDIRRVSLADGAERVILPRLAGMVTQPVFSADGEWMALRTGPRVGDYGALNGLEVMRADGSSHVTIALGFSALPSIYNLAFLPRGDELVLAEGYAEEHDPGVYLVSLASRTSRRLFSVPVRTFFQPEIAMAPDGHAILFMTTESIGMRMFAMDLAALRNAPRR